MYFFSSLFLAAVSRRRKNYPFFQCKNITLPALLQKAKTNNREAIWMIGSETRTLYFRIHSCRLLEREEGFSLLCSLSSPGPSPWYQSWFCVVTPFWSHFYPASTYTSLACLMASCDVVWPSSFVSTNIIGQFILSTNEEIIWVLIQT